MNALYISQLVSNEYLNHGKHGRHGIKKAWAQFFRAFRAFRGFRVLIGFFRVRLYFL